MAKKQEWRVLEGFEKYSINENGVVKNNLTEHVIAYDPNQKGYMGVRLRDKDGVRRRLSIHRLVKTTFDTQKVIITKDTQIHHKDKNKLNNHISNLEYTTDIEHKRLEGKLVLDEKMVMRVVEYLNLGLATKYINAFTGVSIQNINHIKYGETWAWLTGIAKRGGK
jgi:hypothetical protein